MNPYDASFYDPDQPYAPDQQPWWGVNKGTDPYGFSYAPAASPIMGAQAAGPMGAPAPVGAPAAAAPGAAPDPYSLYANFQASPFFQGDFTPPSAADAMNDPGFKASVQAGLDIGDRTAAGRGLLGSTGTLHDLEDYAIQRAQTQYGDVYNRAANTYQLNRQTRGGNFGLLWQYLNA